MHHIPVLLEKLLAAGPVVTDGAWGTQLQARGLAPGECPDAWNLTHPDLVEQVARAYVDAGSQVILSNTFGATSLSLGRHGLDAQTVEINRAGAAISKRAAAGKALVFASIGPSGKMLMSGEVTEEELLSSFAQQAQALKDGGADALVIETMADLAEAKIALAAAKRTGLPVVACVVFDSGKNKDRTMMGNTPEQAAAELTEAGADVIGANCGVGIAAYVPICTRLKANTNKPVWIKANAGLPEIVDGRTVWKTSPEEFAGFAPALVEAGASFLGGCCGTRPEFIAATLKALGR
jgi:5-methyltetrahydrofolate--homocysteine methyltransferase